VRCLDSEKKAKEKVKGLRVEVSEWKGKVA